MKLSVLALALFTALTLLTPSPSLEARGCSCHKVGDEYIVEEPLALDRPKSSGTGIL
jgi:hypothetical protein